VTPDDGAEPEPEAGDVTDGRSAPTNRADDDRVVQRRRPSPGSLLGRAFGLDER
jgi:hypothetical protein